jgi:hypothetical protein
MADSYTNLQQQPGGAGWSGQARSLAARRRRSWRVGDGGVGRQAQASAAPVVDALVAHVSAEDAAVCCEAGDGHAHVVVHLEDLALEGGQLVLRALEGGDHRMRFALRAVPGRGSGALRCAGMQPRGMATTKCCPYERHRCSGSSAAQTRPERLTVSPTAALPCLTASIAYSTWKRRPCGLQVETSVSYCGGDQDQAAPRQEPTLHRVPSSIEAAAGTWLRNMAAEPV